MGLFHTVSQKDGDFDRKSQIFPIPAEAVPLEFCDGGITSTASVLPLSDTGKTLTAITVSRSSPKVAYVTK